MPRAKKVVEEVKEEVKAAEAKVEKAAKATAAKTRSTVKKVADDMKAAEKKVAAKKPTAKKKGLTLTIQSSMGGSITADEIVAKIPANATNAYVKVEENKIYWVADDDAGSVDIW